MLKHQSEGLYLLLAQRVSFGQSHHVKPEHPNQLRARPPEHPQLRPVAARRMGQAETRHLCFHPDLPWWHGASCDTLPIHGPDLGGAPPGAPQAQMLC